MKVTACLLLLASTSMAAAEQNNARAFSLFSVVRFRNNECTTQESGMIGLCLKVEDCADQGGKKSGNCALGFGVCCLTIITNATTITNNVTYIQNEGFPATVLGTGTVTALPRAFPVQGAANICQIRFDFDTAVFAAPAVEVTVAPLVNGGSCITDQITVTQTTTGTIGNGFTNLCGVLTGQHIYVENDGANPAATLNIDTGDVAFQRSWKVLVRTIECDSPSKAPGGCLQYFTGTSGNFNSFNSGTTGALLDDLLYNICIRREVGMCSYTVREARSADGATPDAFQVGSIAPIVAGTPNGLIGLTACNVANGFAWLTIPNSAILAPEYCGGVLTNTNVDTSASPVTGNGAQFQIRVTTLATQLGVAGTGFDLVYAQVGCSS